MKLTQSDIDNINTLHSNSGLTSFQESIASNNLEMFFAFINYKGLKINFNQYVKEQYSLLEYAYINASLHDDSTIFEFLLKKDDVNKVNVSDEIKFILSIQNNDIITFANIISDYQFRQSFNSNKKTIHLHPLFNIIRYALNNRTIFKIYQKYEFPLPSSEYDALFFSHLFTEIKANNLQNAENLLKYLIQELNLNPCHFIKNDDDFIPPGLFSFIYEYTHSDEVYSPVNLFKILNTSPYFNINLHRTFYEEEDGINLLQYTYLYTNLEDNSKNTKKIILDLVKNHENLECGDIEKPNYSHVVLAILHDDSDLFNRCLNQINYNYKNQQGDNLLSHFLKQDYDSDFYHSLGSSPKLFLQLIEHIINQLCKNHIDISTSLTESFLFFKHKAEAHCAENFPESFADLILTQVSEIHNLCEQVLLKNRLHPTKNNEQYKIKKRL